MIKFQNSERNWSQIRMTVFLLLCTFIYSLLVLGSSVSAAPNDTPVTTIPQTTTGPTSAAGIAAGTVQTVDQACKDPDAGVKDACSKGYENVLEGKSESDACKDFDGAKKTACSLGAAAAVPAKAAGAKPASTAAASNPDCDTSLSSPLSWIICPVVDLGSNFTDFVFTTFVRGLLEDVPITTDPNDGSFLAWKQFRTLGNIVLLGSLLAVVYAQARSK